MGRSAIAYPRLTTWATFRRRSAAEMPPRGRGTGPTHSKCVRRSAPEYGGEGTRAAPVESDRIRRLVYESDEARLTDRSRPRVHYPAPPKIVPARKNLSAPSRIAGCTTAADRLVAEHSDAVRTGRDLNDLKEARMGTHLHNRLGSTAHVRFAGRSFDVPLAALDLGVASGDGQIRRALARHLSVPESKLDPYVIDRHPNGNLTVRPEAVFG